MILGQLLQGVDVLDAGADVDWNMEIRDLRYDSRAVERGDLFAALVGAAADGHRFIPMAAAQGAAAVLCQEPPEVPVPWVRVADTRAALALASRNFFGNPAASMTMAGITGTNGKTTSTFLFKHVLERCRGAKVGLIGTNGNRIGEQVLPSARTTPESYELQKLLRRMADAGCAYVVMEVSSHALAQSRVGGISYAVGAFTNLTRDHLDYHGTMAAYAAAKRKLFAQCDFAAINGDDPWADEICRGASCPVTTFGITGAGLALRATEIALLPDAVRFTAVAKGRKTPVTLGIPGRFSVYNALTVLSCCGAIGLTMEEAGAALATAPGVAGRMEPVPLGPEADFTVLIDYAHTPDALENALDTLRETTRGRIVAVFGCGGDRDRTKRPMMGKIAAEKADVCIVTSDNPRTEAPEAIIREILDGVPRGARHVTAVTDRRAAIALALEQRRPGDVILLAGKGHESYQEIGTVKYPMDERQIVRELLAERGADGI